MIANSSTPSRSIARTAPGVVNGAGIAGGHGRATARAQPFVAEQRSIGALTPVGCLLICTVIPLLAPISSNDVSRGRRIEPEP